MALDAGAVYTKLGGRFEPAEFRQFSAATFKAKADMEASERGITAAHGRMVKGAKLAAAGIAGIAVGGTALFVKGAIDAAKKAATFDQELRRLSARTEITEKQLKRVRQAALDQGTAMGVGATMAAKASTELVKGGLSVEKLLRGGLKGALALAVAGEMDVAEAAETTANALNLFNLRGDEATHVADAMATAANATTADVKDFAVALTQGGAAAKAAGLNFDETVAFLETLAAAGVKGSDAGTSMKTALVQLANPTKEAAGLMEKLGIDLFDVHGNIKPLPQLAGIFQDKLKGLTKEQRLQAATTLAGTDGMRALLALYDAGPKQVKKFIDGLKEQGTAAKVAAEQNEGAAGAARRLKSSWEQAQIIVGEQLLPAIAEGADKLSSKLQEMADDGTLKQMGEDLADLATGIAENIPAALEALDGLTKKLGGLGDAAGTIGEVAGAMETISRFVSNPGSLFGGEGGFFGGILDGAKAAVVALKGVATAFDLITPGDQSGPVRAIDAMIDKIDDARDRLAHSDIAIFFSVDRGQQDQIFKLVDKLEGIGKKQLGINIVANADSAAAAIAGLELAAKGVPDKVIMNVIANSRTAQEQVLAFRAIAAGVPASKVTKIQAQAKTAETAVWAFRAVASGVPASKVTKVLAQTNSARAEINGIIGLIAAVPSSKTSTITIATRRVNTLIEQVIKNPSKVQVKPRAAGRPAGGTETALVGEGGGPEWLVDGATGKAARVTGPQFAQLGPQDYVIPTENRYRSGALELMSMLARDLGVPGFKGGKSPKKPRWVPPKLDPIAYDVDDFEDRVGDSKSAIDKAKQIGKNLANARTQLRRAERMPVKTAKQKAARKDSVGQAQRRIDAYEDDLKALPQHGNLDRLRALWKERKDELKKAQAYQKSIDRQQKLADNARDAMVLADKRDDGKGYEKARGQRDTALKELQRLLGAAKTLSEKAGNTDRAVELEGQLTNIASDLIDNQAAEEDESPAAKDAREAAERLADTGMTDAERARLQEIDKNIALAGLTETLEDDKGAAGEKVGFLEQILNAALVDPARGGAAAITEIAGSLKTARENLAALTGSGTNDNADLQAQIDQERERTRVANSERDISDAALRAFGGFAPAGAGGMTQININTLHPGDPKVWTAVAQAANQGNDLAFTGGGGTVRVGP